MAEQFAFPDLVIIDAFLVQTSWKLLTQQWIQCAEILILKDCEDTMDAMGIKARLFELTPLVKTKHYQELLNTKL